MKRTTLACLLILLLSVTLTLIPQALAWELERPAHDIEINERVGNSTTNDAATVGVGVHVFEYDENWQFEGNDAVSARVSATANTGNNSLSTNY